MSEDSEGKKEPDVNGSDKPYENFSLNLSKKGKKRSDCDANNEGQVDTNVENGVEQKKVKLVDDVCCSLLSFFIYIC